MPPLSSKARLMLVPSPPFFRASSCVEKSGSGNKATHILQQDDSDSEHMLRIIENHKNLSALNTLRRPLTELCGQFSVYLLVGSSAPDDTQI